MNVHEEGRIKSQTSADILLTSPWIPAEWVKAHGLEPRAALFAPGFGATPAPVSAGICAFAENAIQLAERCHEYRIVFTTHCDQLRRAFDSLDADLRRRGFLFNLPATTRAPAAQGIFRAELERLGRFLVSAGGHAPQAGELESHMRACERSRVCLREAAAHSGGREYASALKRFHWDGASQTPTSLRPGEEPGRVRLALIGGPLHPENALWEELEAAGAEVVLNATEWGERSLGRPSRKPARPLGTELDPLDLLTEDFFDRCIDVFQRPNAALYDWFLPKLVPRQVEGIILWHYFGCDLWRGEAQTLREKCAMPLLVLEADESGSALERQRNRFQAFVEALE